MSTKQSFVSDIEQSIGSGDPERSARSLRKLTELFAEQSSKLNDGHVSVFDEVFLRLARQADAAGRGDLSASLADFVNAPTNTVKDLAFDSNAGVATPVLERSARVSEEDLVEIATKRAQDHLLAIARRPSLSERITEALVTRGDEKVVRSVAENNGAKLSQKTLAVLAKKAESSPALLDALQKRPDLPPEIRRVWTGKAPGGAKRPATAPGTLGSGALNAACARLLEAAADPAQAPPQDISAELAHIAKMSRGKPVDEVRVVSWIKGGRTEDALAAIAHNTRLPAAMVARAYEAVSYEPLLLMIRAARFNWNTFKLLFGHKTHNTLSADLLKTSFEIFQQVPVETALEMVRRLAPQGKRTEAA